MAHLRLLPLRIPFALGATVLALAASAMPAYAGEDCGGSAEAGDSSVRHLLGEDGGCPPAPAPAQPAPVRVQPQPAQPTPAPVVRAPVQRQPTPRPAPPRPVTTRPAPVRTTQTAPTVQTHQVVPQPTFVARSVPRGAVQAGAGGTAIAHTTQPLPAIAIAAALLGLLSLGSGLRAMRLEPRR